MSSTIHRTSKSSGRQSLFFNDLASPGTARRSASGKFTTPGQSAAVSALSRKNFATSDLPPPPVFTLEDRSDYSSESGLPDYSLVSPEPNSNPTTPSKLFSTPLGKSSEPNSSPSTSSYTLKGQAQSKQSSFSWWSPEGRSEGGCNDKGKDSGSPVEGVVHRQSWGLITVPPPREVARPEIQRTPLSVGNFDEEEWVTVYGFSPCDTNLVLREFERCGLILKHIPGPRDANWIHILYQSRADAEKALNKNGMQINGALIIGVKPVDAMQRQALSNRPENQRFVPLPPPSSGRSLEFKPSNGSYLLQNGSRNTNQSGGTVAAPAKSMVSKITDLMFGG